MSDSRQTEVRHAWARQIPRDLGYTLKSLARAKGYTLAILTTLVLGIMVSDLVYDVSGWVLHPPSSYDRPSQLYMVGTAGTHGPPNYFLTGVQYEAFREQASAAGKFVACETRGANVVINGEPVSGYTSNLPADGFSILGIKPLMGRTFLPGEDKAGTGNVVVLSYGFWKKYFGGSPSALGRKILIGQDECDVVGILGPSQGMPYFFGGQLYRPLMLHVDPSRPFSDWLTVVVRLSDGVNPVLASSILSSVRLERLPAWAVRNLGNSHVVLHPVVGYGISPAFWVTLAAGGFLFAITCLNAANLMLIRLVGRMREMRIRAAVGASRRQIVQVLATEAAVLTTAACVGAVLLLQWLHRPFLESFYGEGNVSLDLVGGFDWGQPALICGLGAAAGFLASAAPLLRVLRLNAGMGLKEGGPASGESPAAGRLRTGLVVIQAAFAVILLTGAGLMVRSFQNLQHMDLGFDPGGKVTFALSLPDSYQKANPAAKIQLFERLEGVIGRLPGVRAVSYSEGLLEGGYFTPQVRMADGTMKEIKGNLSATNFPKVAGLRMRGGRWFSDDRKAAEIVVNESLANERFGRDEPVGRMLDVAMFGSNKPKPYLVVGVVADVRSSITKPAEPLLYASPWENAGALNVLVVNLAHEPPPDFARDVRKALYSAEPLISTYSVSSVEQQIVDYTWAQRRAYSMLRILAAAALFLTVIGLFSVISVSVNSRMPEFGVRMAVGATSSDVAGLVLRRGIGASFAGLVLGIAGAAALTRYLESLLIETKPYDPYVYGVVSAILLGAGFAACLLPARRAAKADLLRLLKAQ